MMKLSRTGQHAPTWAKTEGTGRLGEADASSTSMKGRRDVAGRTRGSDQTNHRPRSSRHPMSLHPSSPLNPHRLSPVSSIFLKILSTWLLSIPSECHIFPPCRSSGYFPLLVTMLFHKNSFSMTLEFYFLHAMHTKKSL